MSEYFIKNQQYFIKGQNVISLSEVQTTEKDIDFHNFFKSKVFSEETRPLYIKENPNDGYLKSLFIPNKLNIDYFETFKRDELFYYLESESINNEYVEDQDGFIEALNIFKGITIDSLSKCYLINKNWFSINDKIVRQREYTLYEYYYMIVWKDEDDVIYVCEWFCD